MTQYERELTNIQALELIPDEEIRKELIDLFYANKTHLFHPDDPLFEKDDEVYDFLMDGIAPGAYYAAALECMFSVAELGGEDRFKEIYNRLNVSPHDRN